MNHQKKEKSNANFLLSQLSQLSKEIQTQKDTMAIFKNILSIITETMRFHVSVMYQVENEFDNSVILKVVQINDPNNERTDLKMNRKIALDLTQPNEVFKNECESVRNKTVSAINIPGNGCDLMSYIPSSSTTNGGYLFGGDFMGEDARVSEAEIEVCHIITNMLFGLFNRKSLENKAIYDNLTGLYNSEKIRTECELAVKRFSRFKNQSLSIVMADIDFFKHINDHYSHLQGDSVLTEVGQLLKQELRGDIDLCGRYGGEEFMFILMNTSAYDAQSLCERIRLNIESHLFKKLDQYGSPLKNEHITITMSFGISSVSSITQRLKKNELIATADQALYESKQNGRNQTTIKFLS